MLSIVGEIVLLDKEKLKTFSAASDPRIVSTTIANAGAMTDSASV